MRYAAFLALVRYVVFTSQVELKAGESQLVTFSPLAAFDFSVWNDSSHAWKVVPGEYTVLIGTSSRDLALQETVQVN